MNNLNKLISTVLGILLEYLFFTFLLLINIKLINLLPCIDNILSILNTWLYTVGIWKLSLILYILCKLLYFILFIILPAKS